MRLGRMRMSLLRRDTWVPHTFCRAGPVCPAGGAGKESPSHGFAVTAPFRQGGHRRGMRIATGALRPRNDRSRKNLRVIPRPVRRLVVGIRNTPAQRSRRTDCHSQCSHWLRNDRVFTRGAVDDWRWSALSPPSDGKIFYPVLFVYQPIFFRQSHQHRLGSIRKNLCVYPIFPEVTIFSSCRENFFVLCSV